MSDKLSEALMHAMTAEASRLLRALAPPADGHNVKSRIASAARKLRSWSPARVRDVWYGDGRVRLRADEMQALRTAARAVEERAAANELAELRARIARIEAVLVASDPDFHRPEIDALRDMARRPHRPVD